MWNFSETSVIIMPCTKSKEARIQAACGELCQKLLLAREKTTEVLRILTFFDADGNTFTTGIRTL
jgi:hypothetical protein